jgi:hypothetical protein
MEDSYKRCAALEADATSSRYKTCVAVEADACGKQDCNKTRSARAPSCSKRACDRASMHGLQQNKAAGRIRAETARVRGVPRGGEDEGDRAKVPGVRAPVQGRGCGARQLGELVQRKVPRAARA